MAGAETADILELTEAMKKLHVATHNLLAVDTRTNETTARRLYGVLWDRDWRAVSQAQGTSMEAVQKRECREGCWGLSAKRWRKELEMTLARWRLALQGTTLAHKLKLTGTHVHTTHLLHTHTYVHVLVILRNRKKGSRCLVERSLTPAGQ